jgi:hypothetical protein
MTLRRSEDKYITGGPLRDISHHHFQGISRIEGATSAITADLSAYIEENKHLRIKCAKIDEIENYANILMENIEKYKRKSHELENRVVDLASENERLRVEVQKGANLKYLKEENIRKEGEINGLRKKMEINDNLQLIRLEQELTSEKQARERMISNIESKHKSELSKL